MAQVTINKKSIDRLVKKLKALERPLTKKGAGKMGDLIVREMLNDISKLKSPVKGVGKFPVLTEPYRSRKGAGNIKGQINKTTKPDLFLTGKFLNSLMSKTNKLKDGFSTTIKFKTAKSNKKEEGHRAYGRQIIPTASEGFNKRISALIKSFLSSTVRGIVRKK